MDSKIERFVYYLNQFMPLYFKFINPIIHSEISTEYKLNENQIKLIMVLTLKGPQHPTNLSRYMNIPKGSLTTVIDSLVSKGLVERLPDNKDGRKKIIKLSKSGHSFAKYKNKKNTVEFRELFKNLSFEDISEIEAGMEMVVRGLENLSKIEVK